MTEEVSAPPMSIEGCLSLQFEQRAGKNYHVKVYINCIYFDKDFVGRLPINQKQYSTTVNNCNQKEPPIAR